LGVQGCEDITEVIVRRRPVAKWPEPAQKRESRAAEAGDVDEGLRSGQHSEETLVQHFVERIDHLRSLAWARQITEVIQKNKRLAKCPAGRYNGGRHCPSRIDSEDHHRFSAPADCHALPSPDCLAFAIEMACLYTLIQASLGKVK
jgi:hypothetical protein